MKLIFHVFVAVAVFLTVIESYNFLNQQNTRAFLSNKYATAGKLKSINGFRRNMCCDSSKTPIYDIKSEKGVHTISFEVFGKKMSFESGKIGRQAGGSVVAKVEDTMVYATACNERDAKPIDFAPLRVDFFARYSAVGQTVGAFHRRDSRGDDNEILVARLIDRPIRPMLHEGWQHETQLLSWVLSYDKINSYEPLAICASSAAATISQIPLHKPVAGVEVGLIDNEIVVNPTKQQQANSTLQLTIAGTKDGILMIEGFSDFVTEEIFLEALQKGHEAIGQICDGISEFQKIAGVPKKTDTLRHIPKDLIENMDKVYGNKLLKALSIGDKHKRGAAVAKIEEEIIARFNADTIASLSQVKRPALTNGDEDSDAIINSDDDPNLVTNNAEEIVINDESAELEDEASELPKLFDASEIIPATIQLSATSSSDRFNLKYDPLDIKVTIKKLLVRILRRLIIVTGKRSDGRTVEEVRPIDIETSLIPCAHGSSLFTRGETQSLSTATLGSKAMEAKYETLDVLAAKKFYLQYKFPPSSVGEVGRVGGISRREVGHGNLAERALLPCIPTSENFPYSIRAESLITESCGSSSMATVCGCCLAMLDAGVPLKTMVAGVAMGLILGENEGEEPVILTDILGLEDALGTMDFKVAGNEVGISTFQLDIKNEGLTIDTLKRALYQAKRGRLHVLDTMKAHLSEPRALKSNIPRILEISVPPDALGKIIGPKGKTVQSLIELYGLKNINLEDDGSIQIESLSNEKNEEAKAAIMKIVEEATKPREGRGGGRGGGSSGEGKEPPAGPPPEPGVIYKECEIKGIHGFGVFVEVLPGYEGLVHISELEIKKIPDPTSAGFVVGQKIDVKCLGINDKGQLRFSRRAVLMRETNVNSSVLTSPSMLANGAEGSSQAPAVPAGPPAYRRRQPVENSVPAVPADTPVPIVPLPEQ